MEKNKKKRLLLISPYAHHGNHSGAKKRSLDLYKEFKRIGLDVILVCPWIEVRDRINLNFDGNILYRCLIVIKLYILCYWIRPTHVVSEFPLPIIGPWKLFSVIHDTKFNSKFTRSNRFIKKLVYKLNLYFVTKIITVSETEARKIKDLLGVVSSKIIVSYNGLAEEWFTTRGDENHQKYYDMIYVSNFSAHKGHLNFLQNVVDDSHRVCFVGGDHGCLSEVQSEISKRHLKVDIHSGVSETGLIRLVDCSRIVIFPSELEGFGMPILEAAARRKRIVANDLEVFRELSAYVDISLVDFSNTPQTKEVIANELENERKVSLKPYVQDVFSWSNIARKLLKDMGV